MIRKALLILSGNAAASLLLLARNLMVARLIPVEDYGVAATFAMVMAMVEMASAFGLQQQIVQAQEGDDPHFQAALQGFQLFRGVIAGMVLFALAGPLARFLGIPEIAGAYQILALVPVFNALQHFDIHRLNRQMRFGPLLLTGTVPAVVALVLVWPLVIWLGDWQVMLWSIMAQTIVSVLVSHLLAERPYRLAWDRGIITNSLNFGWPLLINSMLMFLVFQGDKLIVGRVMGMEALAIFAMGMTLTLTPTLVLATSAQNLFLPRLSAEARTPRFAASANICLQGIAFSSVIFALAVMLASGAAIELLLGDKYAPLAPLLIWFALCQALRLMKAGPAIIALALGHTGNAMIANLVRVAGLPLAWVTAERGGTIMDILLIGLAAEALGLVVAIWLMLGRARLPRRHIILQQAGVVGMILAMGFLAHLTPDNALLAPFSVWLGAAAILALSILLLPGIRQVLQRKKIE
ncbi:MAG: oligosaccharide flippase family protein [Pseudorhodobacter sp.]